MMAALAVNEVDREEYQSTARIQDRCIRQLADLFHVPPAGEGGGEGEGGTSPPPTGFSTVGSSEALELALLALKHVWRAGRRAAGLDASRPNLVVPADVHVTMQKAAVYFDLELRSVPVPGPGVEPAPADLVAAADENSVGVVCVLGTTYTGHFQDAAGLDAALAAFNAAHRPPGSGTPPLRMHIDAASGGFVAPFAFPDVQADFRLANLASLNVSGHKVRGGVVWTLEGREGVEGAHVRARARARGPLSLSCPLSLFFSLRSPVWPGPGRHRLATVPGRGLPAARAEV